MDVTSNGRFTIVNSRDRRLFVLVALLLLRMCIDERESTVEFILELLLESMRCAF